MRKILSGFLFRLIKGWEIWALIAFLLIGTAYIDYQLIDSELGFFCTKEEYEDVEERGYRFSELGVSSHNKTTLHHENLHRVH
jgi:hypothetical protein